MKKTIAILLVMILAISMLTACGGSKSSNSYDGASGGSSSGSAPSSAPAVMREELGIYDYADAEVYYTGNNGGDGAAPMEAPIPMPEDPGSAIGADQVDTSTAQQTETSGGLSEKIIYTANADIEAVNFDETIEKVYDLIGLNGAFIESSYIGGRNYAQSYYGYQTYRSANFVLRVPKDRFETVTGNLDILGNVTSLQTNAENITAQFLDTESRLSSYRIQEERLLAMLEKSDTVADMITIESRLAEVRYSIESLTSTLKNWQNQVDYSTLTLYIHEVENFTETVPIQQTYWQQIGTGLQSTTKSVGRFFTNLFKWIIVNLPVLIILAIIAAAIVIFVRRKIRKNRDIYKNRNNNSNYINYNSSEKNNKNYNNSNANYNNSNYNNSNTNNSNNNNNNNNSSNGPTP